MLIGNDNVSYCVKPHRVESKQAIPKHQGHQIIKSQDKAIVTTNIQICRVYNTNVLCSNS